MPLPCSAHTALQRPAARRTTWALGALGLIGLGLLAGGVIVAPFSVLWVVLLLGLVLIAGLLLFVVAFLPPAVELTPLPPGLPNGTLPVAPAERGLRGGSWRARRPTAR